MIKVEEWRFFTRVSLLIGVLFGGVPAYAENVQAVAIIDEMLKRDAERRAGVDSYITIEGHSTGAVAVVYHEKMSDDLGYRIVMPNEIMMRVANQIKPGSVEAYSPQIMQALGGAIMGAGYVAAGLKLATIEQINEAGATARGKGLPTPESDRKAAEQSLKDIRKFAAQASIIDRQEYLGRDAFLVGAVGLNEKQSIEEGEFTIEKVALWIDAAEYFLLGMNVYGTSKTADFKKPQPFEIHRTNDRYISVGSSSLKVPTLVGMGLKFDFLGQMEEKEKERARKEFEKSKREYEKFQEQMKNASPAEKQMMEQMMKRAGIDMDAMMQQAEFLYEGEFIVNYASIYTANTGDLKDYVETLKMLEAGGEVSDRANEAVEKAKRAAAEASRDLARGGKDPILKNGKF